MKTLPFKYKSITPKDRYLLQSDNPPTIKIEFDENIKNLKNISCFFQMKEIAGEIQIYLFLRIIF